MKVHCWVGTAVIVMAAAVTGIAAFPRGPVALTRGQEAKELPLQESGDAPKGPAKHKIDGKIEIDQQDGKWRFILKGTTDLPDKTQLKVRIHVIERTVNPRGQPTVDDEQITSHREGWARRFEVSNGAFEVVAFEWPRKPFSLEYQARITFERTTNAAAIGEEDFEVWITRPPGEAAVLEAEFRASAKDISGDLEKILVQFGELKKTFGLLPPGVAKQAWLEWRKGCQARIEAIDERNGERWELWAAWIERQGRFRVDGLCEMMRRLLQLCDSALNGDADAMKNAQREFQAFMNMFQEAREVVGLDAPFDVVEVAEQVKRYAEAIDAMRKASDARDAEGWAKSGAGWLAKAKTALIQLSSQRLIPRRGYDQVLILADVFLRLSPLAERASTGQAGDAERVELAKLLAEHDQKLRAFREYANIK